MSLQALCTVAISSTLDSRAYQCRTHSEAHKVLLRQYRRWCATCFGRRTWWQRYGSVSPHLDLNILFVETYQITLIWYYHTRPLQSWNSELVNISGRSQASLVFSDLHLFSFWGAFPLLTDASHPGNLAHRSWSLLVEGKSLITGLRRMEHIKFAKRRV